MQRQGAQSSRLQQRLVPRWDCRTIVAFGCAILCFLQLKLASDASPFLSNQRFASSGPTTRLFLRSKPESHSDSSNRLAENEDQRNVILAKSNAQDESESMAACLLVMDDNHWLIEWIAYHYHVLPLRTLIVVQDPLSKTSPRPILDRWKSRMNITVWDDENFLKPWVVKQYSEGTIPQWRLHRSRQQFFYPACLHALKSLPSQHSSWVLLVDTDEFVRPSPYYPPHQSRIADLSVPGAVLSSIRDYEHYIGSTQPPVACFHIPRLQFSSKSMDKDDRLAVNAMVEDPEQHQEDKLLFNASHLMTTSWFYHAGREISTGHDHLDGKNLIHLGRLSPSIIPTKLKTVHHVLPKVCPVKVLRNETPLIIHHYLGTLEQYTSRSDPRDSIPGRPKRDQALYRKYKGNVKDMAVMTWLPGFVKNVGRREAKRLLYGVGQVQVS